MGTLITTLWFSDSGDPAADVRAAAERARTEAPDSATADHYAAAVASLVRRYQAPHPTDWHTPTEAGTQTSDSANDYAIEQLGPVDLATAAGPAHNQFAIGVFGQTIVIAATPLGRGTPSELPSPFLSLIPADNTYLIASVPADSRGTFAHFSNGTLSRSFVANPVDIIENTGLPETFEQPFWAGEHPLQYAPGVSPSPQALPFHPQEFAEGANRAWLGFRYTHPLLASDTDPIQVPVFAYQLVPLPAEEPPITAPGPDSGPDSGTGSDSGTPPQTQPNDAPAQSHSGNPAHPDGDKKRRWFGRG